MTKINWSVWKKMMVSITMNISPQFGRPEVAGMLCLRRWTLGNSCQRCADECDDLAGQYAEIAAEMSGRDWEGPRGLLQRDAIVATRCAEQIEEAL